MVGAGGIGGLVIWLAPSTAAGKIKAICLQKVLLFNRKLLSGKTVRLSIKSYILNGEIVKVFPSLTGQSPVRAQT
jgi:hypothetical protein